MWYFIVNCDKNIKYINISKKIVKYFVFYFKKLYDKFHRSTILQIIKTEI